MLVDTQCSCTPVQILGHCAPEQRVGHCAPVQIIGHCAPIQRVGQCSPVQNPNVLYKNAVVSGIVNWLPPSPFPSP